MVVRIILNIDEKRLAPRVALEISVKEERINSTKSSTICDISEIGMRYRSPLVPETNNEQEAFLEFKLSGQGEPIKVLGWIVRDEKNEQHQETAVTFMFLPEGDEIKIRNYVQSLENATN